MNSLRTRPRGELESAILEILFSADGPLTAKVIRERVSQPTPALTTVLTVLDRLGMKGRVLRHEHADAPLTFEASSTREDFVAAQMNASLEAAPDREAILLHFAGTLDADDLDVLERAVRARKDGR